MAKVEIEIPDGKVADVTKDGDKVIVTFGEINLLDQLQDIDDVRHYIEELADSGVKWACDLWNEYEATEEDSYSEQICLYRMVVAALTNNEERHLITDVRWYPIIQFCKPGKEKDCYGDHIVGTIESDGQKYTIVGGKVSSGLNVGLGGFDSYMGVSLSSANIGFRSISSIEVAKHISRYFGKLLFDIYYGGTNCDWRWIEIYD